MARSAVLSRYGLGQMAPVPPPAPATTTSDPLWARLAAAFGTPVIGAVSQRIAYGEGGGGYYPGGGYYTPWPGGGGQFGFGGLSQSTIILGVVALGAGLVLSKR